MPKIDAGAPVPLGLKGFGGGIGGDHQVLAIGYDLGRYKVDLGAYETDLKIFILDPNHPNVTSTLVPDPTHKFYYELEFPVEHWLTYFVDGKYAPMLPPTIPSPVYPNDGLVHELRFKFGTGADDMRGGADHVDVSVQLAGAAPLVFQNVSNNGIFVPGSVEIEQVFLVNPIPLSSIKGFQVTTNATGGLSGDNWDMLTFQAIAVGGGFKTDILRNPAGPYRFTGSRIPLNVSVP
jgi:hypothetical protein